MATFSGNRIQDTYNYVLDVLNVEQFGEMTQRIFNEQTTVFRINVSFGFILRNIETGEMRYYHSSHNNARFLEIPHWVRNQDDLKKFIDELNRNDLLEHIRQQRPDTKCVLQLVTNITFYVNKTATHPIGAPVHPITTFQTTRDYTTWLEDHMVLITTVSDSSGVQPCIMEPPI